MGKKIHPIDWRDAQTVKRFRAACAENAKFGRLHFRFDGHDFPTAEAAKVLRYLDWNAGRATDYKQT